MRRLLVLVAACAAPQHPAAPAEPCEIAGEDLVCAVTNVGNTGPVCVEPVLVNRETGTFYSKVVCSPTVESGTSTTWVADLGVTLPRACAPRGCALHVEPHDGSGDHLPDVLGFLRSVQDAAPHLGRDQPSVRECDTALIGWRANPRLAGMQRFLGNRDVITRLCLELPRPVFECLWRARTADAIEHCTPAP